MPFDEELGWVYEKLIKPAFESAGFETLRADNIDSQQNILKDIVTAIAESDVVVADLTEANPNVYYELGLAHALRKQVVLMSQDVGTAPFDLRSYRILEYGDRFDLFEDAKKQLRALARGVADGSIQFGNPVSDFGPTKAEPFSQPDGDADGGEGPDGSRPGVIDSAIAIEQGFQDGTEILNKITAHIQGLGDQARQNTPKIEKLLGKRNFKGARNLLRTLSNDYDARAADLHALNGRFSEVWRDTTNALEMVFAHSSNSRENRQQTLEMVREMCSNARAATDQLAGLIATMNALPAMERMFDKSKNKVTRELEVFSSSTEVVESLGGRLDSLMRRKKQN